MIDERAGMGAIGDMQKYMAFKAARGIEAAANNPGEAGSAASLGLGAGFGMMLPQMMQGALAGQAKPAAGGGGAPAAVAMVACPKCNAQVAAGSKFCGQCGNTMPAGTTCPKCNAAVAPGAKFCGECGTAVGQINCPKCNATLPAGAKFCGECGTKLG